MFHFIGSYLGFGKKAAAPICRLDGCRRPRFEEVETGRKHDFCCKTHASAFHDQARSGRRSTAGDAGSSAPAATRTHFDGRLDFTTPDMVLFWKPPSVFSQWTPSRFIVDDVRYSCAEQYMMAEKAKLFGDETAWQEIIQTDDPKTHKRLGREVHGYNQGTWDEHKKDIVTRGSYAKFSQNPLMGQYLLDTGEKVLAEASPLDKVWGIGLRADHPDAKTKRTWRGQNLLGEVLQEVRTRLLMEALAQTG